MFRDEEIPRYDVIYARVMILVPVALCHRALRTDGPPTTFFFLDVTYGSVYWMNKDFQGELRSDLSR